MTEGELVAYLLDRGLLSPACVTDGSLRLVGAGGRNLTRRITSAAGPAYVVKQGRAGDPLRRREAAVYAYLGCRGDLRDHLSAVLHDDPDGDVLVLEHVDGEDLRQFWARRRRCPVRLTVRTAAVLATLHRPAPDSFPTDLCEPSIVEGCVPISVHRPNDRLFETSSAACVELISLVQSDDRLCEALDRVLDEWQATAVIHSDIRFENVVAVHRGPGRADVRLVDWETATVGDPCWDLGCLIAEYVHHWVASIPMTQAATAAEQASLARFPLSAAQAAIRRVWTAYTGRPTLDPTDHVGQLVRMTRYVGARTVARAFELGQQSSALTASAVCHLQVGATILTDPRAAATALLGIPCAVGRA